MVHISIIFERYSGRCTFNFDTKSTKFASSFGNFWRTFLLFSGEIRVDPPSFLTPNPPNLLPVLLNYYPYFYYFWAIFGSIHLQFWPFGAMIYGNISRILFYFRHIFRYWSLGYPSFLLHIRVDSPQILTPNLPNLLLVLVNSRAFFYHFWAKFGSIQLQFWRKIYQMCFLFW